MKHFSFILLFVLLALLVVAPVAAQEFVTLTPEGESVTSVAPVVSLPVQEQSPVIVVQVPESIPNEFHEYVHTNVLAWVLLVVAVGLIVGGGVLGMAIREVANQVPADFAAPVYSTGNVYYQRRHEFIQQRRQEAALNNITWDDPFWENAEKASAEDWQKFVNEAKAKGVTLHGPAPQPPTAAG
jgi:hypothetical protein